MANRQVVVDCCQLLWQVDSPPPPISHQSVCDLRGEHIHTVFPPGVLVRASRGSSCRDDLALLPYSWATPQSLLPFVPSLGFNSNVD